METWWYRMQQHIAICFIQQYNKYLEFREQKQGFNSILVPTNWPEQKIQESLSNCEIQIQLQVHLYLGAHFQKKKKAHQLKGTDSNVVAVVKFFEKVWDALILGAQILHKPLTTHHILANYMMPLLCMLRNVIQLFHCLEQQHINHLGVGDVGILANLGGDCGAELGNGSDVVEVIDVHDGWDGSARWPEEIEDSVPRFLQTRWVRWYLHASKCERHFLDFLSPLARANTTAL